VPGEGRDAEEEEGTTGTATAAAEEEEAKEDAVGVQELVGAEEVHNEKEEEHNDADSGISNPISTNKSEPSPNSSSNSFFTTTGRGCAGGGRYFCDNGNAKCSGFGPVAFFGLGGINPPMTGFMLL